MSAVPHVDLRLVRHSANISQVIAGFMLLADAGEITLDIGWRPVESFPTLHMVDTTIEGTRITFDSLDGYNLDFALTSEWIRDLDFYFKRSFSPTWNLDFDPAVRARMHPLGLNYHVTSIGNPVNETNTPKGFKAAYDGFKGIRPYSYFTVDRFEAQPRLRRKTPKVIFLTRLWEPDLDHEPSNIDRIALNECRIGIVRALRKEFPRNSLAGLLDTAYAREVAPDVILGGRHTNRGRYLDLMRSSDIGVDSTGLHGSIAWKTAEYLAASKAIVDQRFQYEVPGGFTEGQNYLRYDTVDQCVDAVATLCSNPQQVMEMMKANHDYYRNNVRPDALVRNALRLAGCIS